jgi:hypothetical protein
MSRRLQLALTYAAVGVVSLALGIFLVVASPGLARGLPCLMVGAMFLFLAVRTWRATRPPA